MQKLRVFILAAVALAVLAAPASSGVYYEARTTGEGKGSEAQSAIIKAWASGEKSKVLFESTGNPMMKTGDYLITTDGGQTLYMVSPKDKTYSKWDMDAMMQMAAGVTKMMKMEIHDAKVEKLEERPGEIVAGLPTTYYKFRTTYRQTMKFMMISQDNRVEEVHELWVAPDLVEKALGVYLRKTPPKTVSEDFNRLLTLELEKVKGIPLKIRTVTTTQDKKGATQTTVVTMEVTKLQVMPIPDSTFEIPAGYQEVSLLPTGEGSDEGEGEENPMAKLFGGKKRQ
ncbi:MAG: DUF4412 domain-containing protein [Acidobacteriota bacterium]